MLRRFFSCVQIFPETELNHAYLYPHSITLLWSINSINSGFREGVVWCFYFSSVLRSLFCSSFVLKRQATERMQI